MFFHFPDEFVALAILSETEPAVSSLVTAVGWGSSSDATSYFSQLREVEVPVLEDLEAVESFGENQPHGDSHIFTSSEGQKGICMVSY